MERTAPPKTTTFWQRIGLAMCLLGTVVACDRPSGNADFRKNHPLKVERKTISIVVAPAGAGTGLAGEARSQVTRFAGDFLRRARSPLTITSNAGGGTAEALRSVLMAEGIDTGSIVLKSGAASEGGASGALVLSFEAYSVDVPECGDWSGTSGYNPSNLPHTDFGCSYQRNIGLMVSDPGDLVVPRAPGTNDARHSDRAIGLYRTGKPTATEKPATESGTVSSVGAK